MLPPSGQHAVGTLGKLQEAEPVLYNMLPW